MRVDDLEIPDKWCELLAEVQIGCPQALIAGGCIRDIFFGVEPKDIDFFTFTFSNAQWVPQESSMDYGGMQYVLGVEEYKKDDLNLNMIYVNQLDPIKLLESFDLGFCQIGFDGKSIIKTPAFEWDAKHGRITLRHIDRYSRSIRRYARINQRYNLDLIIPELEPLPKQVF